MPNLLYLLTNIVYLLGLAFWIGGTIVLGAFVAPLLFRRLARHEAGAIFGDVLRRFRRARLAAVAAVIVAAAIKHFAWETHASSVWIVMRWLAIGFMTVAVVYETNTLEGAIERARDDMRPGMSDDDPPRAAFNRLHRRAERLMKASLLAAVVALFLS